MNTSFSNLFSVILKTIKENSVQIKENMKQLSLLIQIKQARNHGSVLGEYKLEGTNPNTRYSTFSFY